MFSSLGEGAAALVLVIHMLLRMSSIADCWLVFRRLVDRFPEERGTEKQEHCAAKLRELEHETGRRSARAYEKLRQGAARAARLPVDHPGPPSDRPDVGGRQALRVGEGGSDVDARELLAAHNARIE